MMTPRATIVPDRIAVEPGDVAEVTLQLQNRGTVVDEFVVEVLGDAAPWVSLSRSRVPIFPQHDESIQVSFKPPRGAHPRAGTIPVGLRVSSTVDPGQALVEECRVEVKPLTQIGADIVPRVARGRFGAEHRLRVRNIGNAPVAVTVRSEVQQGDCEVLAPPLPIELPPGEQRIATIRVRPASTRLRGVDELHQYRLSVEPQGGGQPVMLDASMRQRAVLQLPTAFLLAAALLLGGAYVAYGPGPNPVRGALSGLWHGTIDRPPTPAAIAGSIPSPAEAAAPAQTTTTHNVASQPCVPGAPTGVVASATSTAAKVSWSAPAFTCGQPITAYTVYASAGGLSQQLINPGSDLSVTFTNLTNGTTYTFTVTASGISGTGPASAPSGAVTPATVPGPPLNVLGSVGDGTLTIRWSPPVLDGGSPITAYVVGVMPIGGSIVTQRVPGTSTTATFTGLTNGTVYGAGAAAVNAVGTGPITYAGPFKPLCTGVQGAALGFHWSGLNVTMSWTSSGTCPPFSGTIDCTYQALNSQGQPNGSGTSHTKFATLTGSVVIQSADNLSCSMTINDGAGHSTGTTAHASIPP